MKSIHSREQKNSYMPYYWLTKTCPQTLKYYYKWMNPFWTLCLKCYFQKLKVKVETLDSFLWRFSLISLSSIWMMTAFMMLRVQQATNKFRRTGIMLRQPLSLLTISYWKIYSHCSNSYCKIMIQYLYSDWNYYQP